MRGCLSLYGLDLDMQQGSATPNYVTSEAVARVVGSSPELLIEQAKSLEGSMTYLLATSESGTL